MQMLDHHATPAPQTQKFLRGAASVRGVHAPKPMMHIAYSPPFQQNFQISPYFRSFSFLASPTLTMIHLNFTHHAQHVVDPWHQFPTSSYLRSEKYFTQQHGRI